ncbi:hypothetical protein K458DRAFT_303363 [Lentithecium fluviatile CBS 122367]|uniref:Uncharacterized protein n=1 Tax=Lentithecium fluviatile CBS 122367 TaxID=1168545 RepID=A0A6G1J116_9PLEO|nr:hypothetical protein K458DRAFT_303363 [Lentithecium fluviatile CBS 122367]
MRRVTTCAPIVSERYATDWMPDLPENFGNKTNTTVKFYEFGKGDVGCRATWWNRTTPLTTFCVSQYMKDYWQQAYTVEASTVYQDNQAASDFDPIPDFQVPNADVTLISIYNKASYTGENDDLLFNAKNPSSKSPVFRTATSDLAVLGCLEQYQTCNPVNGKCTELEGLYGVKKAVDQGDLELSPRQNASQFIMWKAAWSMALQWACEILADNVLLAQDWVFTGQSTTSSTLLSNQWEFEAYNLHNLSLAVFQRRIHEFASPEHFEIRPGNNSLEQIDRPTDPNLLNLCAVQKTRSSDHYSLSVLGMTIILGVGSLLILLDWVFIKQILWFRSFTHHRLAKQADWTASGTLQLHRMAMEARGVLGWNTRHYEAPVLVGNARVFRGVAAEGEPLYRVAGMSGSGVTEYKGAGGSYSVVGGEIGHEVGVTYDGVEPEKKC